jgi:uncharacterized membrane protein YfcA
MTLLGLFLSALVGVSLGLLGGGGSILTVPLLHYVFGLSAPLATSTSLAVVGVTAALGAWTFARRKQVAFREGLLFALPSFVSVTLVRRFIVPKLPAEFEVLGISFSRDASLLVAFALVMLAAGVAMLRKKASVPPQDNGPMKFEAVRVLRVALLGVFVGILTGFLGAGGGFLIVPALALLVRLDMKRAVGTSLLIISANSLTGFAADLVAGTPVPWTLLGSVMAAAAFGMALGTQASKRVPAERLKPAFGVFILVMSALILTKELLLS